MKGELYITGRAACELLGISRQKLSYHVKRLEEAENLVYDYPNTLYRPRRKDGGRNVKVRGYSIGCILVIAARVNTNEAQVFLDLTWNMWRYLSFGENSVSVYSSQEFYVELRRRLRRLRIERALDPYVK